MQLKKLIAIQHSTATWYSNMLKGSATCGCRYSWLALTFTVVSQQENVGIRVSDNRHIISGSLMILVRHDKTLQSMTVLQAASAVVHVAALHNRKQQLKAPRRCINTCSWSCHMCGCSFC